VRSVLPDKKSRNTKIFFAPIFRAVGAHFFARDSRRDFPAQCFASMFMRVRRDLKKFAKRNQACGNSRCAAARGTAREKSRNDFGKGAHVICSIANMLAHRCVPDRTKRKARMKCAECR
jgi:hypothetical protein